MPRFDADDYIKSLYTSGMASEAIPGSILADPLIKGIAEKVERFFPYTQFHHDIYGGVGVGFPDSRKFARLPRRIAGQAHQMGTEYLLNVPAATIAGGTFSVPDQYSGLAQTVSAKLMNAAGRNLTDSARAFKVGRAIYEWKAIHMETLTANAGLLNLGRASQAGLVRLMLGDKGKLAHDLSLLQRDFAGAAMSPGRGDPLAIYQQLKERYSTEVARALSLRHAETGRRLTSVGIKDVTFSKMVRGRDVDTMLTLSMSDPESIVPFASLRDLRGGVHHMTQFVASRVTKGISPSMLQPLIAPSGYGDTLEIMRAMVPAHLRGGPGKFDSFGSVVRASVGFVHGPGSTRFWEAIGGDSGAVVTSRRMMRAAAAPYSTYKKVLSGVMGMPGLPDPTSTLSDEILNLPGFREAMLDPNVSVWRPGQPTQLGGPTLGTFKSGKRVEAIGKDFLEEVRFGDTGMQFILRRSRDVFTEGTGVMLSGARATLGSGALMKGVDILGHELKWKDPGTAMERWMSHYADRALYASRGSKRLMERNMRILGEMTGMELQMTDSGILQLHSGSRQYMNTGFIDRIASQEFQEELAKRWKISDVTKIQPLTSALTEEEAVKQITALGTMSPNEAREWYKKYGTNLHKTVFHGQNIMFRQNAVITSPHLARTGQARVRAREAKLLRSKFIGLGKSLKGKNAELALGASKIIGGNIDSLAGDVVTLLAGSHVPLYGEEMVAKFLVGAGDKVIRKKAIDLVDPAMLESLRKELDEFGSISPESFNSLVGKLGFQSLNKARAGEGPVGVMLDLKGSPLEDLLLSSGTRKAGSSEFAVRSSKSLFIPSPYLVSSETLQDSTTGMIGNLRIPRNPIAAGADPIEARALQNMANWWNTLEALLDPDRVDKVSVSRSASMLSIGMKEALSGSMGMIQRGEVAGFTGGRYRQRALPLASEEMAVALTEEGIVKKFSKRSLYAANERIALFQTGGLYKGKKVNLDLGEQMLLSLRKGEEVFAFFKRFPGQTVQQSHTVKLRLLNESKGLLSRFRTIRDSTIWVSNILAAMTQGDFDTDDVNLYLMSQKGMSFKDQQRLLAAAHAHESTLLKEHASRRVYSVIAGDANAMNLLKSGSAAKGKSYGVARALMGLSDKQLAEAFSVPVDDIASEVAGGFHRVISGELIGTAHAVADKQMRVVRALAGVGNEFNISDDMLKELSMRHGLKDINVAHESDYIRIIYGFLKKKGGYSENTLQIVKDLNAVATMAPDAQSMPVIKARLAQNLMAISSGVEPGFGSLEDPVYQAALKAAGGGELPKSYYESIADRWIKVSRLANELYSNYGLDDISKIAHTREPSGFLSGLVSAFVGEEVSPLTGFTEEATPLLKALEGIMPGMDYRTADQTAGAATASAASAIDEAASIGKTVYKKFGEGWSGWKGLAVGSLAFATMMAMSSEDEPEQLYAAPVINPSSSMPPPPVVGFPNDGSNPSVVAPENNFARISRTPGQRRHFPVGDNFVMPGLPTIPGFKENQLARSSLSTPTTKSRAEKLQANYNRDF